MGAMPSGQAKKKLEAEIKRLERGKENPIALSAQKLDDPARVVREINEYGQRVKSL